jgi:hypothetical protein
MAIKGKKKSGSRGSQARRRPAPAPRVVTTRGAHTPWYQTAGGRVAGAIVVVALLAGAGTAIAQVNAAGDRREARQDALNEFTRAVDGLRQDLGGPVSAMGAVARTPSKKVLETLNEDATGWVKDINDLRQDDQSLQGPDGLTSLPALFDQAVGLYANAATSYQVVTSIDEEQRGEILATAQYQLGSAGGVWQAGVGILDEARAEEGLDPSGLSPPSAAAP